MKAKNILILLAFGINAFPLVADDDQTPPSQNQDQKSDQEMIARNGAYRQQSLSRRENNSYNRRGNNPRQESLNNRSQNSQERQESR